MALCVCSRDDRGRPGLIDPHRFSASQGYDDSDDRIGLYDILKPIGKGKFAIVYRASRVSDGETVALKKISIDSMDAKNRKKVLKEVRLLQSLNHPNIISYLDSFLSGNELVIVFEWAAAGDLKRQVRKAQERGVYFEERVVWKYFAQICAGIQHMHARRVMHRDLKPANIFLTLEGQIKVGDLGLGRALSEDTLEAHSKVGTPLYMSPEVLRGGGYDWKSDIWSLGCILYELAMLRSPFKGEGLNLYSLFQKISQGDYAPLPTHYSEDLRQLAYAMISTEPVRRPDVEAVCLVADRMREATARGGQVCC
ncbi:kinase-like domain-containing protein [Tribonema minus]|uniref:non-specific serine/threonine protein kinase n=1 Tax=Tribonema minus TaxID=303371 RepID=A0A835ZIF0_9STRA|nr:kinase-like domain-containing protein [Tribonema minus]